MNRTMLFAFIAIAVLGAVLFSIRQKRYVDKVTGGQLLPVLRVVEAVEQGQPIYTTSLAAEYRPAAYVEPRHVGYEDRLRVIGLRAAHTLRPGSSLVWSDLIDASGGVSTKTLMSDIIPRGQRATAIRIESATFPGLLSTGDRVDVFYSAIQGGISRNTTVLLAQNVSVIRDESSKADQRGTEMWVRNITLATTPQQIASLKHAALNGHLSFAVRHRDDFVEIDQMPYVTSADIVGEAVQEIIRTRRDPNDRVQHIVEIN